MKSIVLRKRDLLVLVVVIVALLSACLWGTQEWVLAVSGGSRELPIYSVETGGREKLVSLGINCAWGAGDIPAILKTLEQQEVQATFFMVGSFVTKYPDVVQRIANAGHEIGNHSDSHADFAQLSKQDIVEEIENCNDRIEALIKMRPTLVRPPLGSYNNLAIETIRKLGYDPIQWSLDSLDWKGLAPAEMEARILPKLTYGDILLFHNDTDYTAKALPDLLLKIKEKGYRFVPVGKLIEPGNDHIDANGRQQLRAT